ncbi:IclR family transcriptional regulator [Variibacter gotjawalensis]|uniref:IclR family transcriptional regulator n=1 Tax=Variibacter gotjawalensis TaxID=1333996 RepID=UPI001D4944DE|nr:IclR family transcriptional regulator [Variibacter gotjawalensis]NIK48144.1 DNA-binding IclR family transcriptional regulator [Variibacter gotjawalensis]
MENSLEAWDAPAERRKQAAAEPEDRKFVTSLARGLEVLRAFTPSEGILGNRDIAQRTGLPKPTVSRLTYTLTKLGYLNHIERIGKYQLAAGALAIGYSTLANMRIRQIARPYMEELAQFANASVALGTRDRLNVIYVDYCRGPQSVLTRVDLGSRLPLATSAIGRAIIGVLPPRDRDWLLQHIAKREGSEWPNIRAGIEQAISDVKTRGFTMSIGDWHHDVSGVGVAIVPADRSGVFALNCGAPAFQITREKLEREIGPRLVNVARTIEATLNGA